jgi:hypothetical protein
MMERNELSSSNTEFPQNRSEICDVHGNITAALQSSVLGQCSWNSKLSYMFIVWHFISLMFLVFYTFILPYTLVVTYTYFSVLYSVHLRMAHVDRNM